MSTPKKLILFFVLLAPAFVRAQSYSIDWHKVAGGGGASAGANGGTVYAVSGTIGQPDAGGPMRGGSFALTGGYWALIPVQTPGAPLLTITLTTGNTAIVSWPSPSTGFALQVTSNLAGKTWGAPPQATNDNGTIRYIIVSPATGQQYYRLINP